MLLTFCAVNFDFAFGVVKCLFRLNISVRSISAVFEACLGLCRVVRALLRSQLHFTRMLFRLLVRITRVFCLVVTFVTLGSARIHAVGLFGHFRVVLEMGAAVRAFFARFDQTICRGLMVDHRLARIFRCLRSFVAEMQRRRSFVASRRNLIFVLVQDTHMILSCLGGSAIKIRNVRSTRTPTHKCVGD